MSKQSSNSQALNVSNVNASRSILQDLKSKKYDLEYNLKNFKKAKQETKNNIEVYKIQLEDETDNKDNLNYKISETIKELNKINKEISDNIIYDDDEYIKYIKLRDETGDKIINLNMRIDEIKALKLKFRKSFNITKDNEIKDLIKELNEAKQELNNIIDKINRIENDYNEENKYINIYEQESESETESETTTESETESEPEQKYKFDLNKEDDKKAIREHINNYRFYGFNEPTQNNKSGFQIFEFKESLKQYIYEDNETLKYILEIIELYNNYQFTKNQQEKYKQYAIRYKFIYDKLDDYNILMNNNDYINDLMALIYIMVEEPPHVEDRDELIKLIYTCFYRHLIYYEDLTDQESEPDSEPETEEEEEEKEEEEEEEDKKIIYHYINYKRDKKTIRQYFKDNFNYTNNDFNDIDKIINLCLYVKRLTGDNTHEIEKIKLLNDCFNDEQERDDVGDPAKGWRLYRLYKAVKSHINNDDTKQLIKRYRKQFKNDYNLKISKKVSNYYNIYTLYYFLQKSFNGLENYEKLNISNIIYHCTIYNIISVYDFEEDPPRCPKFDTSYRYNLDIRGDVETLIFYMNIKDNDIINNNMNYDRYDGINELLNDTQAIINNLINYDIEENEHYINDKYILLNQLIKHRNQKQQDKTILKRYDYKILDKFGEYGLYKEKHEKQLYKFLNMIDASQSEKIENNLIALVHIYKMFMCPEEITEQDKFLLNDYINVLLYIYGEHLNNLKDNNYFNYTDYDE